MAELSPYQAARLEPGTVIRATKDIRLYANTFGSGTVWPGFLKAGHEAIVRATQTVSDSGWSSEVIKRYNADTSRAFLLIDPPYCVENNPDKPITSAFIDAEPTDNLQSYVVVGHTDYYKPIQFITPDSDGQSNPETYDPDSDNISGTDGRTDNSNSGLLGEQFKSLGTTITNRLNPDDRNNAVIFDKVEIKVINWTPDKEYTFKPYTLPGKVFFTTQTYSPGSTYPVELITYREAMTGKKYVWARDISPQVKGGQGSFTLPVEYVKPGAGLVDMFPTYFTENLPEPYKTTVIEETDYSTTTPQDEYPTGTTGIPIEDTLYDDGKTLIIGDEQNPPITSNLHQKSNIIKPVIGLSLGMFILNLLIKNE